MVDEQLEQMEQQHYDRFKRMTPVQRAKEALAYHRANLTSREFELLHMSEFDAQGLPFDEMYRRIEMIRFELGLNNVIAANESAASSEPTPYAKRKAPSEYRTK